MNTRSSAPGASRIWTIAAVLAALVLLFPIGFTTAYLTDKDTADPTTGGTGRWCSVPDPEKQPNVYRLNEFHYYSSTSSSMIIVPVVRNGAFGSGSGGDGRLGVRAWSCKDNALTTNSAIKVTAWRNASSSQSSMHWRTRIGGDGVASHRLDPESGFGAGLTKLHRTGTNSGGGANLTGSDRQKYTWIMSSRRTKSSPTRSPSCSTGLCIIDIEPNPTFATGFQADAAGTREPKNSVEYLASGYWTGAGTFDRSSAHPVNLAPYSGTKPPFANGTGPSSTDGRQVQWVVMEWWGPTTPSDDMVLEVFVQ